ncbi:MAG: hypothetical protein JW763_04515 [candidate division Zixibacteria bacterium]|nr:hypothetical protein [candidate division Zixibacteria bacterium]
MTESSATAIPRPRRRNRPAIADSFLVKYGLKILLAIIVIFVFLTMVQCSIKKPESPTWTTNLTVPLVNRTYLMPEIIDKIDQPGITMDSTGEIVFSYSEEIDTVRVDDDLNTSDISTSIDETLGAVIIRPSAPAPVTVDLEDILTPVGNDIPACSFDVTNNMPVIEDYSWATISSGGIYIVIVNDLGVNLDTVLFDVLDVINSVSLTPTPLSFPGGVGVGDRDSVFLSLSGKTVSNTLQLQIHCHTPGGTVLTLADKSMASAAAFNTISVTAAEAKIPEIVKNLTTGVAIDDGNTIMSADLESGTVILSLTNGSELEADVDVYLPDFTLDGVPLTRHLTIAGNSYDNVFIDLSGYTFEPLDQALPQNVACSVLAVIDSTGPAMAVVDASDNFHFSADISDLAFSSLTGVFEPTEAAFDNIDLDIDLPKGFDSLQLVNAELLLEIENTADLTGELDITVTGNNGQTLHYVKNIPTGSVAEPSYTYILDTNLAAFLNPVPSVITVDGAASFGDGATAGTIHAEDYVTARVTISSPLEVVVGTATFDGDVSSEEIEQDDIDLITDHVVEATFTTNIINHLPLGTTVAIHLSGDSATIYADPEVVIGPISVDAGVFGPDGVVTEATATENIVVLDSIEIQVLENPILYSTQVITLNGSGGQPVKISGTDYIVAQGVISVEYIFDGEF